MLKDITLGQYFPGSTIIHRLDPRTKLIGLVCYIVALFLAKSYASYALMVLVLVVLGVDSEPRRRLRRRKSEPEAEMYDDVPAEAPDGAADSVPDELFDMDSMDRPG